jgi:DNA-binding transcriptional regulator YiaG
MLEEMNVTPLVLREKPKPPHIISTDLTSTAHRSTAHRSTAHRSTAESGQATTQAAATRVDAYVGWRVRSQRQKLGLTVLCAARACRIPPAEWAAYEVGDRRPSAQLLLTMALALKVPLSYFFEGL